MGSMRKRLISTVCVAAVAAIVLAGCSTSKVDALQGELETRGFSNVVEQRFTANVTTYGDVAVFFADAGSCRVVLSFLEYPAEVGNEWMLIEQSSRGDEASIKLPNPTLGKLQQHPDFAYCFTGDDTQSSEE